MRTAFFASFACWLSLLAVGCGGSSSETPPPLEPDPTSARYTGPRMPRANDDAPGPSSPQAEPEEAPAQPQKPGRATWGTGKAAAPSAAPASSMTSPNALPEMPSGPSGGNLPK